MRVNTLFRAWNTFFFLPQSPLPIACFRVAYGLMVMATLILLRPDWLTWYGQHALLSLSTVLKAEPATRLNLFSVMPQSDWWIEAFFWLSLISALLLTIGFWTRINSIIVYLCLTSIQQRNLYLTHGGDTFLRVAGFFLMFAPAGAALSLDRLIRIRRGKEDGNIRPQPPWAQRMIQLELSLLYFVTFCLKMKGAPWIQGTALSYVYHLAEFQRFPLPSWFLNPAVLAVGTWFALALEFSLGVLIWFKEFRYVVLGVGVLFHLFLDYSLNIPLFQWDILSAYILFVDPEDLVRVSEWFRRLLDTKAVFVLNRHSVRPH
jgi:hypothetical protein